MNSLTEKCIARTVVENAKPNVVKRDKTIPSPEAIITRGTVNQWGWACP